MKALQISLMNGNYVEWPQDKWDNYTYDTKYFVIMKDNSGVGFYNASAIASFVVVEIPEPEVKETEVVE